MTADCLNYRHISQSETHNTPGARSLLEKVCCVRPLGRSPQHRKSPSSWTGSKVAHFYRGTLFSIGALEETLERPLLPRPCIKRRELGAQTFAPCSRQILAAWAGLASDDSPLLVRDVGTQEIYVLDIDLP